jgi:hypothetical protein
VDSWSFKMEPIGCTETSVRNYHYSLRDSPEERSSYLRVLRRGSLQFRNGGTHCITNSLRIYTFVLKITTSYPTLWIEYFMNFCCLCVYILLYVKYTKIHR